MRLIGNKRGIIENKVWVDIYWKEKNIRYSNKNALYKQEIGINEITSNYLILNIYNEINE